jgi:hypothetical protein
MFGWLKDFWTRNVAEDVPAELSQCEFGCRATECLHRNWERCETRIFDLEPEAPFVGAHGSAHSEPGPTR